ncbi:DUF2459 domain-containing protein [Chitinibacteraceae bacterium HSL-7]
MRLWWGTLGLMLCAPIHAAGVEPYDGSGPHTVYVVSHGWHTGFVLPSATLTSRVPELASRFDETPAIETGWGDQGFYQAEKITLMLALKAMFWPTPSVMHTVAVPRPAPEYFGHSDVRTLCLTDAQLGALGDFIASGFAHDEQGAVTEQQVGLYGDSQFYSGKGSYSLFKTCNNWTAKGLKAAGLPLLPIPHAGAGSVMASLKAAGAGARDAVCPAPQ